MRKTLTMFLVLWLLASSFFAFNNSAYGTLGAENTWSEKTPINQARAGLGVVAVDGKIYAIGDSTASGTYPPDMFYSGFVGTNEEYDPAALTWTIKLSVPTLRSSFGIAVHENKIYVIGSNVGFDSATELPILCSINEVYDPLTDIWESKKPMPTNRSQLNANVVNGKIYLIGGRIGGQYSTVDLNEVYDPETDSWTTRAPIPYPVVQYASAVVDDKIYIMGGQDEFADSSNLDIVQIYDPATDTWSFGTPMPNIVWQAAAGATTGIWAPKRIYVLGGLPEHSLFGTDTNQVYNPENDSWTLGDPMPTSRFNFAVGVLNDTLYAIGGAPFWSVQGNAIAANELYIPFGYEGTLPPYWSPSPSPSSSPTTSPTPTPSLSSVPKAFPSSSASEQPTETPEPQPKSFLTTLLISIAVLLAIVCVGLLFYFKKHKHG